MLQIRAGPLLALRALRAAAAALAAGAAGPARRACVWGGSTKFELQKLINLVQIYRKCFEIRCLASTMGVSA